MVLVTALESFEALEYPAVMSGKSVCGDGLARDCEFDCVSAIEAGSALSWTIQFRGNRQKNAAVSPP